MFMVHAIALTTALFGYSADAATGCYPTYAPGTYEIGDWVSATKTTTATATESCVWLSAGCGADGFKTVTTATSETNNYQCTGEESLCSQSAYDPTGQYSSSTWTKESVECSGIAAVAFPTVAPTPALWDGGGCPAPYASGTYDAGDVVSVVEGTHTMVYRCKEEPTNLFCGMTGFEPGTSQHGGQAWTALGSCSGTIAPTLAPEFVSIADAGGCPAEFSAEEDYEEADRVGVDDFVYECKAWPSGAHCSQAGFEPGSDSVTEYWKEAWTLVGYCSGTIAPTTSPVYVTLADMGGCPDEWSPGVYEEGDMVAGDYLVYECQSWPESGHCGQAGYEPNTSPATPDAWKIAWTLIGFCSGSMGPTSSPTFDAANFVGACPEEWSRGSNTAYDEGDMVSVTVSDMPLRQVAFKCKAWPYSGHCGQFSPEDSIGGPLGWTLAGSCGGSDVSLAPTGSPSFDRLAIDTDGCPDEYSSSVTDYEDGDHVAWTVSAVPSRKIVYKCRPWPYTEWCNNPNYKPGSDLEKEAWTLVGACTGSTAPTLSPTPYVGTCQYNKCITVEEVESCVIGQTGCSCTGTMPALVCERMIEVEDCNNLEDVEMWSSSVDYVTDDVVRVGTKRFKCREWPNYFWCRSEAYVPTEESGIWTNAWTVDGMCS
jgi:hypothetical protein